MPKYDDPHYWKEKWPKIADSITVRLENKTVQLDDKVVDMLCEELSQLQDTQEIKDSFFTNFPKEKDTLEESGFFYFLTEISKQTEHSIPSKLYQVFFKTMMLVLISEPSLVSATVFKVVHMHLSEQAKSIFLRMALIEPGLPHKDNFFGLDTSTKQKCSFFILKQFNDDATRPTRENVSELIAWEQVKFFLSDVAKLFEKQKITVHDFLDRLNALDPYINGISYTEDPSKIREISERIRDILFVLHETLPLFSQPEQPKLTKMIEEVSLKEKELYKIKHRVWQTEVDETEKANLKTIHLFSEAYAGFCELLQTYTTEIFPVEANSEEKLENALLFNGITIKDSFIQALYSSSDLFRSYISFYQNDKPNTIQNILAKINNRICVINTIEDNNWDEQQRNLSNVVHQFLFEGEDVAAFYSFMHTCFYRLTINNNFDETREFFVLLNRYLEKENFKNTFEPSNTQETEKINSRNEEKRIEAHNHKKEALLKQISNHDDLCQELATLANSTYLPPDYPKKENASKNVRKTLRIFLDLYETNNLYRETLDNAPENTLGHLIIKEIREHNLKRNHTTSSQFSQNSSETATKATSPSDTPTVGMSFDEPKTPPRTPSRAYSKNSAGQFFTTIDEDPEPLKISSISTLLNAYLNAPATNKKEHWTSILDYFNLTFSNSISRKKDTSALFEMLSALKNILNKEPNKVNDILTIIDLHLSQKYLETSPPSSPQSKKRYPVFAAITSHFSSEKLSPERVQKKQQAEENKCKQQMLQLCLKDEKLLCLLADLLKRAPDFSLERIDTLMIGRKNFSATVFQQLYDESSVFCVSLATIVRDKNVDQTTVRTIKYEHV